MDGVLIFCIYIKLTSLRSLNTIHSQITAKKNEVVIRTIWFSGQVVSAEILYATEHGCPIELHKIPIDKCDEMYDEECTGEAFMPFHRALYDRRTGQSPNNPREQVSMIFRPRSHD